MPKTPPKSKHSIQTPSLRILKKASCPSISKNATLGYRLGCDDKGAIYVSIYQNSNGGFFSAEWLPLADIQDAFENACAENDSITSIVLQPLFEGKSVNTPSFLLAALANEKVIVPHGDRQRHFQLGDIDGFIEKINKLMTSKGSSRKTSTKKKTTTKKASLRNKRTTSTTK